MSTAAVAMSGLVACSSSGHPRHPPSRSTPAGTATPSGVAVPVSQVRTLLHTGEASIRSAHLQQDVTVDGQSTTAVGDEQLRDGVPVALQLASTLGNGQHLELRVVDGRTYAQLPASEYRSRKPWVLVDVHSPVAAIRSLATDVDATIGGASVHTLDAFLAATTSARRVGTGSYDLVVDVAKLPADYPGRANLRSLDLATVPVRLVFDSAGRPVQFGTTVTVLGRTTTETVRLSRINEPVTISAPPADQVGTS